LYGVLIYVVDSFTVDGATHLDLKNEETVKHLISLLDDLNNWLIRLLIQKE
jgi:hypothetical protein